MKSDADIRSDAIEWLWPGRVAIGQQTLITGEGGKSHAAAVGAAITSAGPWPCDQGSAPLGSVIVLSVETSEADSIMPLLKEAGADAHRVHLVDSVLQRKKGRRVFNLQIDPNLQADLNSVEKKINELDDVRLVIIDPISSYVGLSVESFVPSVYGVLEPVSKMAERLHVPIISITHPATEFIVLSAQSAALLIEDADRRNRPIFLPVNIPLWLRLDSAITFAHDIHSVMLATGVPKERFDEAHLPEHRQQFAKASSVLDPLTVFLSFKNREELEELKKLEGIDIDMGDYALFYSLALLSAACASGEVRTFAHDALGNRKSIPASNWHDVKLRWSCKGLWEDIWVNRADLLEWFLGQSLLPRRRGRKSKVDWNGKIKRQLFKMLDHHGLPDASDPDWSTQADVEAAVAKFCGVPLAESTVRAHTASLISEWNGKKAEN